MCDLRKLDINIHDSSVGIWQDDPNDPTFRDEIYLGLIKLLKRRGWTVTANPETLKRYRCLSPGHRIARKGNLHATLELSGRHIEFACWTETWAKDNQNGHRYDFNKWERLTFLDRLRLVLERKHMLAWLGERAALAISDKNDLKVGLSTLTAVQYVEHGYATSWHTDKALGRPVSTASYNITSADGKVIEHGSIVWTIGRKGRIERGVALYNINNMWWVVGGAWTLRNQHTGAIFVDQPPDLRQKRNERERRVRLESELQRAIRAMDFRRAETLRRIIYGDHPVYLIWSRKNDAYYAPQYCGYSSDLARAGRYTRAEAEREVRRVPHHLHAIAPDGSREDFGTTLKEASHG